jgi:hypothetical protein
MKGRGIEQFEDKGVVQKNTFVNYYKDKPSVGMLSLLRNGIGMVTSLSMRQELQKRPSVLYVLPVLIQPS